MKLANAIKRCFKRSNSGWATEKDIRSLLKTPENGGVVIGGYEGKPLIYGGNNHVVAVGGPRSWKTAGLVIPTLMSYRGSVVVHDVGGELYKATADHRRAMGQKIIRFAPSGADSPRFNPMDTVRFGTEHELDDVKSVAAAVCPPVSHFDKWAFSVIVALLLHGISEQGRAFTLADAYQLSQRPGIVEELAQSTVEVAREFAKDLMRLSDNEVSGILSTVAHFLGVYDDAFVARATSSSDFDLNELQNGDTPVTLYLVTDAADTKRVTRVHQALLALIIKKGLGGMGCAAHFDSAGCMQTGYKHKLLLMLDDYARFERGVDGLADGLAVMAGYGIQSYVAVQNADQLKTIDNIVANSHIRVFLQPADMQTAEYVSKQLVTSSKDGCRKPLLTPDELFRLPPGPMYQLPNGAVRHIYGLACLTLRAGNAPILGAVVPYLAWKQYQQA
ncbi:type IV secretory system conjugative DNA transfer family protein [Acidithiobacillus ferriphilus]|uniref:type IV secretory system conjugative DNA transfer family protein n=1 Tax=Acidithiobacillus ferriphilus TaxID=1689834 RepID=UPI001C06B7B3|nr:type IV secretory system conjugative DNA transfer family protein [Acidithiobacillus ferriphilus]MBU2831877.1 type IV secretory system conjugative DNA transfer family protein [Acidithiobacillus ferriphilus]